MIIRILLMSVGVIIFILGIILFPLPGPFGIPTMAIGLTIILKTSDHAKRIIIRLVHKNKYSSHIWRKTRNLHKRIRR